MNLSKDPRGSFLSRSYSGFVFLLILLIFCSLPFLQRDFWFDEALTLLNFAMMGSPARIYSNYVIPNNQIIHTIFLHEWIKLPTLGFRSDFFFRLLPLLFSAGTLGLLYFRFKSICGKAPLIISLSALAVSSPFLIYATALRGYIMGAFFTVLTLCFALDLARRASLKNMLLYFFSSLLLVGTIPSNLLASAGIVLYVLPLCGKNFLKKGRFYLLALLPLLAFACFYVPIWKQFLGCCRLGEGWSSGIAVVKVWFITVAAVFNILLILALPGKVFSCRFRNWPRTLIWLLPIPAALLLPTSPFPRVFFPMLVLLAVLTASGLKRFLCYCSQHRIGIILPWSIFAAVLISGYVCQQESVKLFLSRHCGDAAGDDYFYSYYLRPEHVPSKTAEQLAQLYANQPIPAVFISFSGDPWPVMYYTLSAGLQSRFLFDGPGGVVRELPPGTLLILNRAESPARFAARFNMELTELFSNQKHRVLVCR